MEDEDFGFARRDESVLKKVLHVEDEQTEDKGRTSTEKYSYLSTSKVGEMIGEDRSSTAAPSSRTANAGNLVPRRSPVVPSVPSAPKAHSAPSTASVVPNTPNIPNVVEYHLKVKPTSTPKVSRRDSEPKDQRVAEMKKDLLTKLSRLSIDNNVFEGSTELPQVFQVKYLGSHDARGLWGIKHTRRPVDNMVSAAKALPTNTMLPLIKLVVSREGVALVPLDKRKQESNFTRLYHIETISYGVQDLVYTRVFSMIVVRETDNFRRVSPFECHGFVCESKHHARQLTYALATAFEIYSRTVKARDKKNDGANSDTRKRFAIDLRSPEEIEADLTMDSEA